MKKYLTTVLFILAALVFQYDAAEAAVSCTNLSSDLSSGITDAKSNGEVTKLQNFLKAGGYLAATPNGVFGPATLAAVKAFQAASGISATGTVGPLTRIAVQIKSCATTPTPTTTTTSNTTPAPAPTIGVTVPATGQNMTAGQVTTILWSKSASSQNIILEDEGGIAQGFVASSRGSATSYSWKAGYVYSTKSQSEIVVPPGKYRIRITGSSTDQISGYFTIVAPELVIKSIVPSQVVADNTSSVVIYGSGFTSRTSIYLDNRYGISATKLFVSPDGKIIVFSIPPSVSTGVHSIVLDDNYSDKTTVGQISVTL